MLFTGGIGARIPLLAPRFWLLVLVTIWMKWRHRRDEEAVDADYLKQFYTRSKTSHVEVYGDAYRSVRSLVVTLAAPQVDEVVLDVATGGGYQAAQFAAQGNRVVGVDYVLDRAVLARDQHSSPRSSWGVADMSQMPFKDNAFDIVTITFALHDLPNETQVHGLRELRRVARKRVVIVEPRAPRGWPWRQAYAFAGELLDESLYFRDYVLRDFEADLEAAGLHLVSRQRCYFGLVTAYLCEPVDSIEALAA